MYQRKFTPVKLNFVNMKIKEKISSETTKIGIGLYEQTCILNHRAFALKFFFLITESAELQQTQSQNYEILKEKFNSEFKKNNGKNCFC